jgi:hypothetical protein
MYAAFAAAAVVCDWYACSAVCVYVAAAHALHAHYTPVCNDHIGLLSYPAAATSYHY